MLRFMTSAALAALLAFPVSAQQEAPLSLEHRMLLRCSAAFAIVVARQDAGDPEALAWPPLKERGGEFFVRAAAKVMDEAALDRDGIADALGREARALSEDDALARTMPPCLDALEAAGL